MVCCGINFSDAGMSVRYTITCRAVSLYVLYLCVYQSVLTVVVDVRHVVVLGYTVHCRIVSWLIQSCC
jgi:hypothetical protein